MAPAEDHVDGEILPEILTYEESDVPKWKLDRFREWLRVREASEEPDMLVGRAIRAPGA